MCNKKSNKNKIMDTRCRIHDTGLKNLCESAFIRMYYVLHTQTGVKMLSSPRPFP